MADAQQPRWRNADLDTRRREVSLTLREIATICAALEEWCDTTDDIDPATEYADGVVAVDAADAPLPLPHAEIHALCSTLRGGRQGDQKNGDG